MTGTDDAELLAGESDEHDGACLAGRAGAISQGARDLHDAGGSGGVVVGAVVYRAHAVGIENPAAAASQAVIMGADDDRLTGEAALSRQHTDHVPEPGT